MTVTWSDTVRNAMLDQWETSIGVSAIVRIYSGAAPTHVSDAQTGTKLAEFALASDWAGPSASGVKAMTGTPLSTTGIAAGTAGHYAIYATDGTTCHERGSITATGGGGDMTIDNTSIAVGQTVKVTQFQKTMPGA
jgi:hypothetical protein